MMMQKHALIEARFVLLLLLLWRFRFRDVMVQVQLFASGLVPMISPCAIRHLVGVFRGNHDNEYCGDAGANSNGKAGDD